VSTQSMLESLTFLLF